MFMVSVGKYTSPMDPMGYFLLEGSGRDLVGTDVDQSGPFGSFLLHQLLWKGSTDGWLVLDVASSYCEVVNAIV